MEYIRQAIERAKEHPSQQSGTGLEAPPHRPSQGFAASRHRWEPAKELNSMPSTFDLSEYWPLTDRIFTPVV